MSQSSRRPAAARRHLFAIAALVVPLCVALLAPLAGPASAATTGTRRQLPASVGTGLGASPASAASDRAADLCARVGARAGFDRPQPLITAVAVALAESGCDKRATGYNGPTEGCPNGSVDRGLWQINSCYHPEVSRRCAYHALCNAKAAYAISSGGTDFTPWVNYNNGVYQNYVPAAQAAVQRLGTGHHR